MNLIFDMMKFLGGLGIGMLLVYLLIWLVFVYPYSEVKLGFYWAGLTVGIVIAVVINLVFGLLIGPMD